MHFNNGTQIEIELVQGAVATALEKVYKHLQHVPLNFKKWDNPFYHSVVTIDELIAELVKIGSMLGIQVDPEQCSSGNQLYYNQLHKIYETNYNGNPTWLEFHEHIHLCEEYIKNSTLNVASIDYRERAGPLIKPFDPAYLSNMVNEITPGMVYVQWSELGKTAYGYWSDCEPENLERMCQLVKPWLTFKPKLLVATRPTNLLSDVNTEFHNWWKLYEADWCKHWNIESWPIEYIKGVIQVGTITQVDKMIDLFRQHIPVERVTLQ